MTCHGLLEVELVLHIDSILDQIVTKSWKAFKREPIGCASTASHGDIRVIDHESVVVGAVESYS